MTKYTNYSDVPLPLAVWLAANDGYDLKPEPFTISATSLMKSTKSLVLGSRMQQDGIVSNVDVSDLIPARLGTAVHTAAENSWLYSRERGLTHLGIPLPVIKKWRINPDTPGEDPQFDLYLELRSQKKVGKWTISGKFDFVENGRVKDLKTTKVYNWIMNTNDEKYIKQGSIYRWLNTDIITDDKVDIMMLFTDWSALQAQANKDYPPKHIMVRTLDLMSLEETDRWIKSRVKEIEDNWDIPQQDLPACTSEELWMQPAKYAYYKNPNNTKRSTKNCSTMAEAQALVAKNGCGKVVTRLAEPKFCNYCEARQICLQAQDYVAQGILTL